MEVPLHEIRRRFPNNHLDPLPEMLREPRFEALFALQNTLRAELYLTGGIIRDSITGSPPKDFDFVVRFPAAEGDADTASWVRQFEEFFGIRGQEGRSGQVVIRGPYGRMTLCGTAFGVYKLLPHGSNEEIDIAFPRTDHAPEDTLGGARDIIAQSDPGMLYEQDVLRRDFTINGGAFRIAWTEDREATATFVDYVGTLDDLEHGVLRAIGNPRDRINESLDRILRAVRFAQKGFRIEQGLAAAIREAVAGDGIDPETRALRRRRPDGRYVVAREIIAVNLLKGLALDAAGTVETMARLGILEDVFPDFLSLDPLARLPQMPAELRARIAEGSPWAKNADRTHEYEKALVAVRLHQATYPGDNLDEIIYLLSFWLGRCPALAEVTSDGRVVYADAYRVLSQILLRNMINETALDTLPATSKYRIHPRRLLEWLGKHGIAIGLLGDMANEEGEAKSLDAQRMALLRYVFPELTGDPFWRILQSLMLTSPEALLAKERLPMLAAQLRVVESFDASHPRPARDLLDGKILHDVFYLRGRVIKIALERSERAYNQLLWEHGYVSDARAKRALLRAAVTASQVRAFWRATCITSDDVHALLPAVPRSAGTRAAVRGAEMLKRSMLRAIERQVVLCYTGATWGELVAEEPVLAALEEHRSFGRETGEIEELGAYLASALVGRPAAVLAWLERSFTQPDSFASRMLPELRVLIASEQGFRQDDRSLDELTYRLGLNSEAKLELARVLEATKRRT
jgi:tRNA nucleotidyltransferase/poly(A) polymerase